MLEISPDRLRIVVARSGFNSVLDRKIPVLQSICARPDALKRNCMGLSQGDSYLYAVDYAAQPSVDTALEPPTRTYLCSPDRGFSGTMVW